MNTKEIIYKLLEATDNGDFGLVRKYYNQEFVDHSPDPVTQIKAGPGGVEKAFVYFNKIFPIRKHLVEDIIVEGDRVAARITFMGKGEGRIGKIDFTGREFKITGITFYRFKDDQIIEKWTQVSVFKELGINMDDIKQEG